MSPASPDDIEALDVWLSRVKYPPELAAVIIDRYWFLDIEIRQFRAVLKKAPDEPPMRSLGVTGLLSQRVSYHPALLIPWQNLHRKHTGKEGKLGDTRGVWADAEG